MEDDLDALMLDALRRGIIVTCNATQRKTDTRVRDVSSATRAKTSRARATERDSATGADLDSLRATICLKVSRLSRENSMKIGLAIAQIAGIESICAFNNGCSADISKWTREQLTKLHEVIQFISK